MSKRPYVLIKDPSYAPPGCTEVVLFVDLNLPGVVVFEHESLEEVAFRWGTGRSLCRRLVPGAVEGVSPEEYDEAARLRNGGEPVPPPWIPREKAAARERARSQRYGARARARALVLAGDLSPQDYAAEIEALRARDRAARAA